MTTRTPDQDHGATLALRMLKLCQDDGATGVALLNAIGNALVGFFMTADFENHAERMKEVDQWCKTLRGEIDAAGKRVQ